MADELVYVGDPMCSWCWGFAPVFDALRGRWASRVAFRLVLGGLRPGPHARVLDAGMKTHLRQAWDAVESRTGQSIARGILAWDGFLYDTGPACRAVVAARRQAPALEYAVYRGIQSAFYAENQDVTRPQALVAVAASTGLDAERFRAVLDEPATTEATEADFRRARALGVQGFPTVLLNRDGRWYPVSAGYQPLERLESVLEGLLT